MNPNDLDNATFANLARRLALAAIYRAGSGHPGGSLSAIDILTVLYRKVMTYDVSNPLWDNRDRFILSKGHAAPALYAVAALVGFIPIQSLAHFRKIDGPLQGHPNVLSTPWVETSTGSLGQGISVAVGMALGAKHSGYSSRVYVILGDGEMQEGEVWEAFMSAAHYGLSNLCAVLDYNKLQSDDSNANIMGIEPVADKWRAFGWNVMEIDGHSFDSIEKAFDEAQSVSDRPTGIIAHTVKGHGVSFMAGQPQWHGSVQLKDEELVAALVDLGSETKETELYLNGIFQQ